MSDPFTRQPAPDLTGYKKKQRCEAVFVTSTERSGRTQSKKKQSYPTPAQYGVRNGKKPTDHINNETGGVFTTEPMLCKTKIVQIFGWAGEKHLRNM